MGCRFSCRSSGSFDCVRVVHINGYVEDFADGAVTVSQVTGKPPKLVLCSPAQLLSFKSQPLGLDDRLEPGRLYFLLPHSVFQSDSSPVDLASLATRLTAIAKRGGEGATVSNGLFSGEADKCTSGGGGGGGSMTSRVRPAWKPILDSIDERSFGRCTQDLSCSGGISAA